MASTDREIVKHLQSLGDPVIASHSTRFFKSAPGEYGEGDKFLGLRVPQLRALVKTYKDVSEEHIIALLKNQFHEVRLFAIFSLVSKFERAKKDPIQQTKVVDYYLANTKFVNNWDLVDSSAHKILGAYLIDKDRKVLYELAKSTVIWERRIAMMTTYFFIKRGEFTDTLRLAEELLYDKHDLIHKIVGWMLREVGNMNRDIETDFLLKHYKNMPRTMLRYAIEKYSKEDRKRFLDGTFSE